MADMSFFDIISVAIKISFHIFANAFNEFKL